MTDADNRGHGSSGSSSNGCIGTTSWFPGMRSLGPTATSLCMPILRASKTWNRVVRAVNGLNIRLYRDSSGRVMGKGARQAPAPADRRWPETGAEHTVPVSYFEDDGRYVVTGSAGGASAEPQWFRNLRQAEKATIEVGPKRMEVSVAVAGPHEHKILWEKLIANAPFFAKYETKAGREIPMATLTRLPTAQTR